MEPCPRGKGVESDLRLEGMQGRSLRGLSDEAVARSALPLLLPPPLPMGCSGPRSANPPAKATKTRRMRGDELGWEGGGGAVLAIVRSNLHLQVEVGRPTARRLPPRSLEPGRKRLCERLDWLVVNRGR